MIILSPFVLKKESTGLSHRKRGNVLSPLRSPPLLLEALLSGKWLYVQLLWLILENCSTFEKYIMSSCPHSKRVMNAKQVSQPFVLGTRCFSFFFFFLLGDGMLKHTLAFILFANTSEY